MTVFDRDVFDGHEAVAFHADCATDLLAIVAIHTSVRGAAFGACACGRTLAMPRAR